MKGANSNRDFLLVKFAILHIVKRQLLFKIHERRITAAPRFY